MPCRDTGMIVNSERLDGKQLTEIPGKFLCGIELLKFC